MSEKVRDEPLGGSQRLILVAMIFAVSMIFIDMTIVSVASPEIQKELALSREGLQWVINGYLLALAAFVAFGGRLADTLGNVKVVVAGVLVFSGASLLNGFTPTGGIAEAWIITFRVVQGAGAALIFPAALAIVMNAFPLARRGRATAVFFGVTNAMTAVGPIAGGYLSEWTWRAIFWVNVPIAIGALVLTFVARPGNQPRPAPIDWRGLALIVTGMSLSILALQQSDTWGWTSPAMLGCLIVGIALLAVFVLVEARTDDPLIRVQIFRDRAFAVENGILFFALMAFIPVFFFASMYSQISLGLSASEAGLYLLIFFVGVVLAVQAGGRMLDAVGAKVPIVIGLAMAVLGYAMWGRRLTDLSIGAQWYWIVLAGFGTGLMLNPSNTDAVSRAGPGEFGEGTGITQTVRNFGSALGLAVLGTILIALSTANVESSLEGLGLPTARADEVALALTQTGGGDTSSFGSSFPGATDDRIYEAVKQDYAQAMQVVFYGMAGAMAVALLVALIGLRPGKQGHEASGRGGDPSVAEPAPI